MNDEIKEILDRIETASEIFDCLLKPEECTELLDYITNLQQKIEQYENPNDMTLFYMWLDTKAKDKMKELQQENEKLLNENIVIKDVKYMVEETIYKSRLEKAIEYIDKQKKKMYKSRNKIALFILMKLENILQNGSDDNETIH